MTCRGTTLGSVARHTLWYRWLVLVTLGELAGFSVPATVAVWTSGLASGAQLVTMSCAGLFEGALLGAAQAVVLRRVLPGFGSRMWVVATSLAAALAWFLGMLPSTTRDVWSTWPVAITIVVGSLLGVLLLASIGTAQVLVLPASTVRRWSWLGWTAVGWCAGLAAFSAIAPPLWHQGQPLRTTIVVGLAGGVVMAAVMAGVTGVGMTRLVSRQRDDGDLAVGHRRAKGLSPLMGHRPRAHHQRHGQHRESDDRRGHRRVRQQ